ncbi:hypothetical protein [Rhodoplanes sp. Z2-YC6860]|uniref:hypothetical protein n=1 Tax=Rhodoplanes sp. Z2-YC6860 TaxID=674703 RepID=UPI00078B3632|nr:hypothetical protein [Rhodoplanes sp. Z2-YC6860]AMN41421.1 hypothetical protein RHPLAN_29850 [Rhodoplanes sp. Z2-YC6860]
MLSSSKSIVCLSSTLLPALLVSLTATSALAGPCTGPGAPATTQTKCLTAIHIPGNALRSFDISFVNQHRGEYYLSDRSNAGVDVIDVRGLKFKRTLGGFVGVKLNPSGAIDNNHSGPDGVVAHGRWVYAGDGDSTLKVFDLDAPHADALKQTIATGGTTRVDEMALTTSGEHLLAANNAEDPPFATLLTANGDSHVSHVSIVTKISVDPTIIPAGFGLSLEQPSWDPVTRRFYTSIPIIANNPPGCNYGQVSGSPITCDGGLLVTNPRTLATPTAVQGAFDPSTNEGVVALHGCGPNGSTVGPFDNLLLGCTPANNPSDKITLVINGITKTQTPIAGIVGSDEVWFNRGDQRYYTGSNRQPGGAVLGVIDALRNTLVETIPQSSGSHSVAAEAEKNLILVPQVAPVSVVGSGGDTTAVGAGICGDNMGCIAVYRHRDDDDHGHDHDHVAQNGNH